MRIALHFFHWYRVVTMCGNPGKIKKFERSLGKLGYHGKAIEQSLKFIWVRRKSKKICSLQLYLPQVQEKVQHVQAFVTYFRLEY